MAEHRKITNLRPRIHAGNTRTAPPAEPAQVRLRGNNADPVLDFDVPRGHIGDTPEFEIGNVRPAEEAAARLRGTAERPILDLDLPRGLAGAETAPTDEAVAGYISTGGAESNAAVGAVAEHAFDVRSSDFVTGAGIRRIIATKDAEHPTSDGDLLLLLETPTFFEDFSSSQVGTVPFEWTPRWVYRPGGYEVIEHQGRKILHAGWTGDERRLITWDALNDAAQDYDTVEVAYKWRSENRVDIVSPRAVTHARGNAGSEWGYYGGRSNEGRHAMGTYENGSANLFARGDRTNNPNVDEWWVTRFRVEEGNRMVVRSWRHGFPEPTDWVTVNLISDLDRGWIGVLTWAQGRTQYDWFSAAFDGGRAPLGA